MLSGKTALISGGTGALGKEICLAMARHGATIAFTYNRNAERAKELAKELEGLGRGGLYQELAASDGQGIEAFVKRLEDKFSRLDILVNNIGIAQVLPFALIDIEDWDRTMEVNLKSMFLFSRAVVRGMIRRKAGVIINLGSIAGRRMLEVPVHYATSKAAVTGFTVSLAKELCRYGIRVNEVVPGLVEGGVGANTSERQLKEYNQYCAMGRPGKPAEVAELVAFLGSDRASYINAQSICIDGGL